MEPPQRPVKKAEAGADFWKELQGKQSQVPAFCREFQRQAGPQFQTVKGCTLFKFTELENGLVQQKPQPGLSVREKYYGVHIK